MASRSKLAIFEEAREDLKCFRQEVRCLKDIEYLDEEAVIELGVESRNLEEILVGLFDSMFALRSQVGIDKREFLEKIFADSSNLGENKKIGQTLRNRIQITDSQGVDERWTVVYCSMPSLRRTRIGVARLSTEVPLGPSLEQCQFIVLILAPTHEKGTKCAQEIGKTYASLLSCPNTFERLLKAVDGDKIKEIFNEVAKNRQESVVLCVKDNGKENDDEEEDNYSWFIPFKGIVNDARRKAKHYISDFTDGYADARSFRKVISTAVFLVFTILPTSIAYGMLNDENTKGMINVQKVIIGQWIGGLFFGLVGGQQLLILSTTAPLSIYIHVIYNMAQSNGLDFFSLYAWVGVWSQIFLAIFAIFNVANLMKFTKRSTEEIFGLFIAFALTYKALAAVIKTYNYSYRNCGIGHNGTMGMEDGCSPESALLFPLMVFGTLWIGLTLDSARKSHYLTGLIRDLVSDYALPIAVIIMAIVAKIFFFNVEKESFNVYDEIDIAWAGPEKLPFWAQGMAVGLGFPLSLLFYMDQLLVTNTVDNKQNNLKKGSSMHWDLLVVSVLNVCLSLLSLPWMHGALPSAYLHFKALADVEHRVHNGVMSEIMVKVRETRLAVLLAHLLMIPIYFYLIPYFTAFVPTSLFHGLFLFMAISSLTGNEMWQRVMLLFTEQRSYPAIDYLRRVPQRIVHTFTLIEILQLVVLIVVGFYPLSYVEMVFPVIIALFIPFRHFLLPLIISKEHLEVLDSEH
ncbi:unnamed protein product, partial [Mesorhabditis belari]|uniref:Bicarbonate transporter-like transmembrane domain-containing protein n=1 Tax=Mesorhabditis belari TaxID=2138241 RepID=A0AAF3FR59_9BILA